MKEDRSIQFERGDILWALRDHVCGDWTGAELAALADRIERSEGWRELHDRLCEYGWGLISDLAADAIREQIDEAIEQRIAEAIEQEAEERDVSEA